MVIAAERVPSPADSQVRLKVRRANRVTTPIAVVIAVLSLIPIGFIAVATIQTGVADAARLVFRPLVAELLVNTVALVVITVPACIVLGVAVAWCVERTDVGLRGLWGPLFAAPLAVPAFVNSYAWVGLFPSWEGLWPAVVVLTLSYFPFVYLPVAATLRRLDPRVEEVARSLGSSPFAVFRRIVVPQLRLAITGGAVLIALHLLAEFGAFAMLRYETFTVAIYAQFQSAFVSSAGTMLAGVLVLLSFTFLVGEGAARGSARYASVGAGVSRRSKEPSVGRWRGPTFAFLAIVAAASLGVPGWMIFRWLVIGGSTVWQPDELLPALSVTLQYALIGALVTTVLAFPVAWVAVRAKAIIGRAIEGANYLTSALPGIVIALALITVTVQYARPLYQTPTLLVGAYVLMFIPRALVSIRSGLVQIPDGLGEVSQSLGVSPLRTFARITLRLSAPAAASGAALVFVAIGTELTATLLLSPLGTQTLATQFWAYSSELDYAAAAPHALIMVMLAVPVTYLMFSQSRKVAGG